MDQQFYRVVSFRIVGPYTLHVRFDDGTSQTINFQPVLAGELYAPLRDLESFEQVRIDPDFHTLVWPNDADFHPDTLHDWPKYADALVKRAREWESATIGRRRMPENAASDYVGILPGLPQFDLASGSGLGEANVPPRLVWEEDVIFTDLIEADGFSSKDLCPEAFRSPSLEVIGSSQDARCAARQ